MEKKNYLFKEKQKITFAFLLLFSLMGLSIHSTARAPESNKIKQNIKNRAADCAPATALTKLEYNNVSALIEAGGSMWQDRATNNAAYEIPKGSGLKVIYSGGLWMGGVDFNDQIKIASNLFRQGNDFWTGPLTTTPGTGNPAERIRDYGPAEVSSQTCLKYDKFFPTTRQEIVTFNAWYLAKLQGIDGDLFPGYSIPQSILNWPAHGDVSIGEDFYLAPFYDRPDLDGVTNGIYDPENDGDYPYYDINGDLTCANDRTVTLYGDQNFWWVFNDRGSIHTETGGEPIGMEIHAQAFAFATNDEVNDMTFYNYEVINRSTQTLYNTYFGQFVDPDIGGSKDDFVGCDVKRGLGYAYNGDNFDATFEGALGYGSNPPAVGVDFFEGPYQDNDDVDNPFTTDINQALQEKGIPYEGIGIGYGDGIIDNERFGMRKFVYFNLPPDGNPNTHDPDNTSHFYNYLRGIWKDNTQMVYGGNGHISGGGLIPCDYMFPGDSDPLNFGTHGTAVSPWDEINSGNQPNDRRFLQAAGPFTLAPGAVNNITVGVVYARATGGNSFSAVEKLRKADDKAQALFDNCFKILNSPTAPEITMQEMDKEIILYLSNPIGSNNVNENYEEIDPFIIAPDSLSLEEQKEFARYRFQGYKIYQVISEQTSTAELSDPDKARLVAQCDIKDSVTRLVNFILDEQIGFEVPMLMVEGEDKGIKHSFRFTHDAFSQNRLINHRTYYYMAVAYAHNNFKTYIPNDPNSLDGQKMPYLESRMSMTGRIRAYASIPHIPVPEANGTVLNAQYGDGIPIQRIEGAGSGTMWLKLTQESENNIVNNYKMAHPIYQAGFSPVEIKVIDPLQVPSGNFEFKFIPDTNNLIDFASWQLINLANSDTIFSDKTIHIENEQLIPELGISVQIKQPIYKEGNDTEIPEVIGSKIYFADSSKRWLTGVKDQEGFSLQNWIRSGTQEDLTNPEYDDYLGVDNDEFFETFIDGTWAPFYMCATKLNAAPISTDIASLRNQSKLQNVPNVDIVFTNDKSKWTRCPVIEMGDDTGWLDGNQKMRMKNRPSVDKFGLPDNSGTTGLGWFPGYAIDIESGERLNMAFGEDSRLAVDNGRDMLFNPTQSLYDGMGVPLFGGKHYIYIFRNVDKDQPNQDRMPLYDEGNYLQQKFLLYNASARLKIWQACVWVGMPLVETGHSLLETDCRIELRLKKKYKRYATQGYLADVNLSTNDWFNLYRFSTDDVATIYDNEIAMDSAMELINVVPNPYYAYSAYEKNKIDTRVKVVNLPEVATIKIFTVDGKLVRTLTKDNPITSIDWDLKNNKGIPIASGVYLIHVSVPGVGEKVLRWMGFMRPPNLDSF